MKYLADQLGAAEKLLSPAEFNAIVFNNLGSDFYPSVVALSSRLTPVSYLELLSCEEIRLRAMQPSIQLPSAQIARCSSFSANSHPHVTYSPPPQRNQHSQTFNRYPNNSNDRGSSSNYHFNRSRSNSDTGNSGGHSVGARCQICRQFGDYANHCQYCYQSSRNSDPSAQIATYSSVRWNPSNTPSSGILSVSQNLLRIRFLPTHAQVADIFTKPLSFNRLITLRTSFRMKEGQKDIFYTIGECEKAVENAPFKTEEERAVENSPSKAKEEAGFC
ncbi:hypothetical protein RJ639_006830 [Escallonia herrerae]|uniref:Uncharacterized protein n=1 Tax=Escallonia herrerae TaxID=1293975 RepID=A0AA88VWV8_9ASTE|nr:hypothetical protein RJ639_006830 [Escallonia herrerae]